MSLTWNQLRDAKITWGELKTSNLTWNDLKMDKLDLLAKLKDDKDVPPEVYAKFLSICHEFIKNNPDLAKDLEVAPSYNKENIFKLIVKFAGAISSFLTIAEFIKNNFIK